MTFFVGGYLMIGVVLFGLFSALVVRDQRRTPELKDLLSEQIGLRSFWMVFAIRWLLFWPWSLVTQLAPDTQRLGKAHTSDLYDQLANRLEHTDPTKDEEGGEE